MRQEKGVARDATLSSKRQWGRTTCIRIVIHLQLLQLSFSSLVLSSSVVRVELCNGQEYTFYYRSFCTPVRVQEKIFLHLCVWSFGVDYCYDHVR